MSASSPPEGNPPPRRLKLKVVTPPRHQVTSETGIKDESSSPVRPSYSPVTPTLSHASLATKESAQHWIDEPQPLPVSLDDNPDAIALKATISLLQMQRQRTLNDIRVLDRVKQKALNEPENFVKDLRDGKLNTPATGDPASDTESDDTKPDQKSRFDQLPDAQNIVRCPPIEWSKYHVVGGSLDRLHELQKQYPGSTEEALLAGHQLQPHQILAPYRPFVDKVEPQRNPSERDFDK